MVKNKKSAQVDKRAATRKKGGDDDSYSFDDGGAGSESGEEAAATAPDLSMDSLRKVFHLPCVDAATALGVAHSKLKRRCHKLKIARWPQRKLASLVFLRDALPNDPRLSASQREAIIYKIDAEYSKVMQDPNHPLDKELEQLRKSNYKLNYNRKLRCAAKAGKRSGSVGDTEAGTACGGGGGSSWQAGTEAGLGGAETHLPRAAGVARWEPGGGADGTSGGGGGSRATLGIPAPLSLGRASGTSPTGSGQENGITSGVAHAADSPICDNVAADDDVAAAAVAGFSNSPRKVVHRRIAAQLGGSGSAGGGGGNGGGAHSSGLGRRSSLERTALLSLITDGKIMKQQGAGSRRQSGSGSGNATPRQMQSGGPSGSFGGGGGGGGGGHMVGPGSPLLRRNMASPVVHGGGGGSSDLGLLDAVWTGQNPSTGQLKFEQHLQQQQQPLFPQQRGGGLLSGEEKWSKQSSPRAGLQPSSNAGYGTGGAADAMFNGATSTAFTSALGQTRAAGPTLATGGGGSVVSTGVDTILNDTSTGGLLIGLEAMVSGVGGQRPVGAEQLSEEELALLGIQGPDRDLLLDPATDSSMDPLLDLLLVGSDALVGAGSTATGIARQTPSAEQHQHQQEFSMLTNPLNGAHVPTPVVMLQQQQQQYSQLDSQRLLSSVGHQQPHAQGPLQAIFGSAALGPTRRLSDALPSVDALLNNVGAADINNSSGVSPLLRTSASGLPQPAGGYGSGISVGLLNSGGGTAPGGTQSAPQRQHRLSSVSGLSTGAGQRPSRFAGGLELPSQPLEHGQQRLIGTGADGGIGGGGGVFMGTMSYDDRYSAGSENSNRVNPLGLAPQLASRHDLGDDVSSLGRRREAFAVNAFHQSQQVPQTPSFHLNHHPHQHVLNALEGRHSAPGQICIPGWDEGPRQGHGGNAVAGNLDANELTRRMLQSSASALQPASDLLHFGETETGSTSAASAAAQRLAAALGTDMPGDGRAGIGIGGCSGVGGASYGGGDRDIAHRLVAAHARSNSNSALADSFRDGLGSRPSTAPGYHMGGAAAVQALPLLNRRDIPLGAPDPLARAFLHNGSNGSGGGGPAAVAAALGAPGLHSHSQRPILPADPAAARGMAGHVSPSPETIVSLQGLRLRGDEDRLPTGELPSLPNGLNVQPYSRSHIGNDGVGSNSGDLAAMLQELQHLRRQQQQQIQEQAQQIQRQQMQIARLGGLSRLSMHDDPYGGGNSAATWNAEKHHHQQPQQPQRQIQPISLGLSGQGSNQGHSAAATVAANARQQMPQTFEGCNGIDGGLVGGGRTGGILEAVDFQLTDIDSFMERNMDLLRRNSSGFGSFMNEMRASGLAGGSGGSFSFGGSSGLGGSGGGGGGGGIMSSGGNDVELMRQNLRKELRQNSAEQWEEMLRQLTGNNGGA